MNKILQPRRQFIFECLAGGLTALLGLYSQPLWARQKVIVRSIYQSSEGDKNNVIFDLSASVRHHIFTLHNPERVVIDLNNARVSQGFGSPKFDRSLVRSIRYAKRERSDLRVVVDLVKAVSPRSFLLPPADGKGHRLLVELQPSRAKKREPVITANPDKKQLRDVVIAIDAGHGGKDPGAIGRRYKTREKDVVLAIARRLEALIKREKGMRAVMIRNGDVFLPLRTRIARARQHQADLFISIHADAARNRRARGSSVYVLSKNGASSEAARVLAENENRADLKGGVLFGKEDQVAKVIVDLMLNATIEASIDLADGMLRTLKKTGKIHRSRVEQAGFVVLKAHDMPSVLVETAFLSNAQDERRLRSKVHQRSIAKALLGGIKHYLKDYAPPGTLMASMNRTTHVIRSGETLSAIAQRYDVEINTIRYYNALKSDRIRTGQVLQIPISVGG
ncbi:MAG: N-acetylmuramoyl-L-alanine amidase [Pseudomonadota bacterium]